MLTQDDRNDIVMEVLQRIAPDYYKKYGSAPQVDTKPRQAIEEPVFPPIDTPRSGLKGLLKRIGPLPPYSALIGQCADGLPFLFDLSDPDPGAILIMGDEFSGKSELLKTILASASALNPPERVAIDLITPNTGDFESLCHLPHTEVAISTYDRASSERIIELAAVAEQRKSGRERGPVILLAIDDLYSLVSYNEYELTSHLRWLLKYGPRLSVWPIATLDARFLKQVDRKILAEFGTRFIGHSDGYQLPEFTNNGNHLPLPAGSFSAVIGSEKVNFRVPSY